MLVVRRGNLRMAGMAAVSGLANWGEVWIRVEGNHGREFVWWRGGLVEQYSKCGNFQVWLCMWSIIMSFANPMLARALDTHRKISRAKINAISQVLKVTLAHRVLAPNRVVDL